MNPGGQDEHNHGQGQEQQWVGLHVAWHVCSRGQLRLRMGSSRIALASTSVARVRLARKCTTSAVAPRVTKVPPATPITTTSQWRWNKSI
jgi:hypothetical protein